MLLTVIFGASTLYLIWWILWIAMQHNKYDHIPGPKRASFFLGNLKLMATETIKAGNLGSFFLDLTLEFGDVFVLWRATLPTVVTCDLPAVKEYYTNLKLFKKPKQGYLNLSRIGQTSFLGNHSILSDAGGPNWERKKRIMDPGFKISRLQEHISKFYVIGEQVADDLEKAQIENGFVDFAKVIAPYTIHAISSAGFSVISDEKLKQLSDGATVIADHWVTQFKSSNFFSRTRLAEILGMDGPSRPVAEKQLKYLRELGKQLILDRVESGNFGKANDALDFIIRSNEENGELNMKLSVDDFMTMYEAGNVTTATTLSFFIAQMTRNVDCLEKLIREVDEIWVGRGISRNSSNQDIVAALKDMVYLDAVINETLRIHPPVTVGNRILQHDMKIQNYAIPAGVAFTVSQQVMHHHPQFWKDPDIFNPDRFLHSKDIIPFTFVPFIVGPRRCLGKNFAILEMKVFISIWLSRLTFEKSSSSKEEILTEQSLLVRMLDTKTIVKMRG
ncbi:hypothetical protein ACHWQZ_G002749 [Mnemiopsis leidyi]